MTGFLRRSYADTDLDPMTGPTPTYANPGSVEAPGSDGRRDSWCVPCGVEWVGGGACWCCGGGHRPILHGERVVCTCGDFNCASLDATRRGGAA